MAYLPNTVLTRRKKKGDPLDVVKVVGLSPIKQASLGDWQGANGDHIIVQPAEDFGSNEIMPMEIAQSEYEISEYPEEEEYVDTSGRGRQSLAHSLTPEQTFAQEARGQRAEKTSAKPKPVTQ